VIVKKLNNVISFVFVTLFTQKYWTNVKTLIIIGNLTMKDAIMALFTRINYILN